jgi:hypothetical protein
VTDPVEPGGADRSNVRWVPNLLLIWAGWATNLRLFSVVAVGALVVGLLALIRPGSRHTGFEWLAASWIVPYAVAMRTVSYLSPYGGGRATLSDWGCAVAVAIVSLAIYFLAVRLGTTADRRLVEVGRPIARWFGLDMPMEDPEGEDG